MARFKHPHLVRGIVHTPHGAFTIVRGVVDLPDEIGDALGWDRAESPAGDPRGSLRPSPGLITAQGWGDGRTH
jgi:hypothetical protein